MAKMKIEDEPKKPLAPEVFGFGLRHDGPDKWVVVRVSNRGVVDVVTPKRTAGPAYESKVRALARLREVFVTEFATPRGRRVA